jgi:hypothetical protein
MSSRRLAWAAALTRTGAGVLMLARPDAVRAQTGTERLLMRTIGVRDLVLGVGGAAALIRGDARSWIRAGIVSDLIDAVVAARSSDDIGRNASMFATLLPLPLAAAGVGYEVGRMRGGSAASDT